MFSDALRASPARLRRAVRERWHASKPVGGNASNRSGDNAASFGSFLGGRKERPRQLQLAENPATSAATNAAFFGSFLGSKKERPRKLVGGKARNRSGDNAASFGSFLGGRKERPRKTPLPLYTAPDAALDNQGLARPSI